MTDVSIVAGVDVDNAALFDGEFDELSSLACSKLNGLDVWEVGQVIIFPGPRTARALQKHEMGKLVGVCQALLDSQALPRRPDLVTIAIDAQIAGGEAADVLVRAKREILEATAAYLWRCPSHGGLKSAAGYVIFPSAFAASPPSAPSTPPAADPPSPDTPPTAQTTTPTTQDMDNPHKRPFTTLADQASMKQAFADLDAASAYSSTGGALDASSVTGEDEPPSKKRSEDSKLTFISVRTQFSARMSTIMTRLPECDLVLDLVPAQKLGLLSSLITDVEELLRLTHLDASLDREKGEMQNLQAGLRKARNTGQPDLGCLWLHQRLLAASEEGTAVNSKIIDEEFATIKKVVGMPKHGAHAYGGNQMHPVSLAPAFHAAWPYGNHHQPAPGPPAYSSSSGGKGHGGQSHAPYGGRGHYGPPGGTLGGGGGGFQMGKGSGKGRKPVIVCGKCKHKGMTDLNHSHTVCPFTTCFKCGRAGHTKANCPG